MLYYLTLSVLLWNACHLLYVYVWRRRGREKQRRTGFNGMNNDEDKIMKL